MRSTKQLLFFSLLGCFMLGGCNFDSPKRPSKNEVVLGKIKLMDGWARPGSQGQTSGIYLTVLNGTASVDTLLNVKSDVANKVEIHKSIKNDDGTMSMRPAGQQVIKDGNTLQFKPGDLHIMLLNLNRDLAIGDSVSLTLEFTHAGAKTILVPVKIQQ